MKELFKLVTERLSNIQSLRWIDMDKGQLRSVERPALAFPAALIAVSLPSIEDMGGDIENTNANITLRLVFDTAAKHTSIATPEDVREQSISYLDTAEEVHQLFLGYEPEEWGQFACREFVQEESRSDGLVIIRLRWETNKID